jgi:hypothetical protein
MTTLTKMKTRTMKSLEYGSELKIAMHVITKHNWEYYLEEPDENGISFGLVLGFEDEMGDVLLDEIRPYAICYAEGETLNDIMPATNWKWV